MADTSCTSTITNILPYVGPLFGVAVGASITWFLQRNEWGRQRRWELRRDAVLDAIRAHADLESALVNLNSCLSGYLSISAKGLTDKADAEVSAAALRFRNSRTSFRRAYLIADLAVGGQFSIAMSAYFRLIGAVSTDMRRKRSFLDNAKYEQLVLSGNSVILSARQALGITDAGDPPRFDDDPPQSDDSN
jgi:hypothetical protein